MDRIQIILDRLRDANLKLKASKCILFAREVKFLGHIISKDGVKTDPAKVEAVLERPLIGQRQPARLATGDG